MKIDHIAMELLKDELGTPKDIRIFHSYHKNNPLRRDIVLNTISKVKNIKPQVQIEPPEGKFSVVLTHDVDIIKPSWKYYAYHIVKAPLTIIRKMLSKDSPYMTFEKILKIENEFGFKSTFFFMANEEDPFTKRYSVETLSDEIGFILDEGFEVGLHGSFYAFTNFDLIVKEKRRLEKVAKTKIVSYRNHYLRFHIPKTWLLLEKAGFKYDSTLGYNDLVGFRAGIPYPLYPLNPNDGRRIKVLEVPLNVMDGTLFEYMKLNPKDAYELILKLIDIVEKYNGVLVLLWHNDKFDGLYWKNYEKVYVQVLKYLKNKRAWVTSLEEFGRWWKSEVGRN